MNSFRKATELNQKLGRYKAKVAISVDSALIGFYWELGKMIAENQTAYGTGFLEQVSKGLKSEFPEMKGLSYRNLALCRQFYHFYQRSLNLQQLVADLKQTINIMGLIYY